MFEISKAMQSLSVCLIYRQQGLWGINGIPDTNQILPGLDQILHKLLLIPLIHIILVPGLLLKQITIHHVPLDNLLAQLQHTTLILNNKVSKYLILTVRHVILLSLLPEGLTQPVGDVRHVL